MHLIPINGQYINDSSEIAGYTGNDQGRQFLDDIAAAFTTYGQDISLSRDIRDLKMVSRASRKYKVSLGLKTQSLSDSIKNKTIGIDSLSGVAAGFTYTGSRFQYGGRINYLKGANDIISKKISKVRLFKAIH